MAALIVSLPAPPIWLTPPARVSGKIGGGGHTARAAGEGNNRRGRVTAAGRGAGERNKSEVPVNAGKRRAAAGRTADARRQRRVSAAHRLERPGRNRTVARGSGHRKRPGGAAGLVPPVSVSTSLVLNPVPPLRVKELGVKPRENVAAAPDPGLLNVTVAVLEIVEPEPPEKVSPATPSSNVAAVAVLEFGRRAAIERQRLVQRRSVQVQPAAAGRRAAHDLFSRKVPPNPKAWPLVICRVPPSIAVPPL